MPTTWIWLACKKQVCECRAKKRPGRPQILSVHRNTGITWGSRTHGIASMFAGGSFLLSLGSPVIADGSIAWIGIGTVTWSEGGLIDTGWADPGYTWLEWGTEWSGEKCEFCGSLAPAIAATYRHAPPFACLEQWMRITVSQSNLSIHVCAPYCIVFDSFNAAKV